MAQTPIGALSTPPVMRLRPQEASHPITLQGAQVSVRVLASRSSPPLQGGPRNRLTKNFVNARGGTLVASYNYADKDTGSLGARLNNSEILWQQYLAGARAEGLQPDGLKQIIRSSIQGAPALTVLNMVLTVKTRSSEHAWTPDNDEFFALLATDNCKGAAYLLKDHKVALGRRSIASIVTKSESYIRIVLTEPAERHASASSAPVVARPAGEPTTNSAGGSDLS